jgi:hypothetical protein
MTIYAEQVEEVTGAVEITTPTSFTWFGAPSPELPARMRRAIAPAIARSHLLFILRNHIYNDFYRVGFASRMAPEVGEASVSCRETHLAAQLAQANCGGGCWEPGWIVRRCENGAVAVRGRGLELWVTREDCRPPPGAALALGCSVALRLPKDAREASPGYYAALSDQPLVWDGAATLVRIYWNMAPAGAAPLMRAITSHLNAARLPFRLKVLNNAISYSRCDTAVLYMLKNDLRAAAPLLAAVYRDCREGMRPGVPAFTKTIGPGVGLAEDIGEGESFGQHRSQLLAEGLIRAFEHGERHRDARVQSVVETFTQAGVDLDHPYLRRGSADDYDLSVDAPGTASGRARREEPAGPDAFLAVATEIGGRLVAEAVWHRDRCNWLGLLPHVYGAGQIGLSYGALGHDLYDGTSGIALFLAELHCLTGDDAMRRTALGAIRQALRAVNDAGPLSIGLYTGSLGVAFAAASVGILLSEEALAARARHLVGRIARDPAAARGFDFLSGRAGGVTALLVLHEAIGEGRFLDLALRLGNDLIRSAEKTACGWSWRSDDGVSHRNLTGLSHGAAGAAHALVELFDLTGEQAYRTAAEEALGYERAWFSEEAGNWPDFREQPRRRKPARHGTFRTQWCHGAAGIALSRLRAQEVLGEVGCHEETRLALATTERDTLAALQQGTLSYCLCHGLGGNADVLLEGREVLSGGGDVAKAIGTAGMVAHSRTDVPWPCGIPVPGRETPGLMLGLAGIGHFYARLALPALIPTLLLPRRRDFSRRLEGLAMLRHEAPHP